MQAVIGLLSVHLCPTQHAACPCSVHQAKVQLTMKLSRVHIPAKRTTQMRLTLLFQSFVKEHRKAASRPASTPSTTLTGPCMICHTWLPVLRRTAMSMKMVYPVMAIMSSKLAAATTRDGMAAGEDTALWMQHRQWFAAGAAAGAEAAIILWAQHVSTAGSACKAALLRLL